MSWERHWQDDLRMRAPAQTPIARAVRGALAELQRLDSRALAETAPVTAKHWSVVSCAGSATKKIENKNNMGAGDEATRRDP